MSTVAEQPDITDTSTIIEDKIAALPEDLPVRAKALEKIERQLENDLQLVRDELKTVMHKSLEQNMNSDEKVFAEISGRYDLSSEYGVSKEDFDIVLDEIYNNENVLAQLRRLTATGAEMTIVSVNDAEILLIDSTDNVDVEAQETFLSELPQQERAGAISSLQERFPEIEQLLQRSDGERGLNYYDYLLICEITGAEPMSEDQYRELQDKKPVDDRQTICWLLTRQEMLDNGGARVGYRGGHGVYVGEGYADDRSCFRAGRPLLRVQRT